jgi:diguanylate cyclase (GGDEF)-like protein
VHRALRYSDPFSVLLLDLDHFKSVNDAFGHARGDVTLTELAGASCGGAPFRRALRYGGDEFVLFLPRTTRDQASVLADRLIEQIATTPFEGKPPLTLTISVGVATLPDDGTTAEQLLARADARMYEAKRTGRARAVATDSTREAELLLDDGARLIERLDGLDRTNRFFETLLTAPGGALRLVGPLGSGRSRMLREVEKLANLRGYRVIRLEGRTEPAQPFSAIRGAIPEAAQLPLTLTDPTEIAAALRRAWAAGALVTVIAADEVTQIDRASLAVVRALVTVMRGGSPVGVVHHQGTTRSTWRRAELRSATPFNCVRLAGWSTPGCAASAGGAAADFVDWMYEQSAGMPGNVREKLLQLVEHRRLIREDEQWVLAPDYRDVGLPEAVVPAALRLGVQPAPTRLVGSEGALRQVLRLVRTTRLVTLCGPAGCGKSRLALEVALEVTENLRDGVALVTLQPSMTLLEVASAIALRLDLPGLPGADAWVALARQLRTRKLLLVLDGFEEVEGGAQSIALLLAHAPELRILVTSRQALGLQEEWAFPVD